MTKNPNTPRVWDGVLFLQNASLLGSPFYLDKINKVSDILQNYEGKFLDIGIGMGNLENMLINRNIDLKIYGVDISPKAIANVKNKLKGFFYVSDIFKLPFNRSFFEVATVLDVLEHIYQKDALQALNEISRVLKKGGGLIVSVPLNENLSKLNKEKRNLNHHLREYTFEILERELNLAGFQVREKKYIYAFETLYGIKTFLMKFIPKFRKPNLLIVHSVKI